ncbi:hypothetical protein [Streptomyces sp. CC208A]|uniref:hypothetical protein n=1 Tax=Streptomyces sp. CC208A TaxID=3044573 RepID=UPI0024A89236|nr:hypothetical protein [Streptomyces sp. CC208A]
MDPITAAALAALAGSIGSEAGRNAWLGLTALVRRPFRRGSAQGAEDEQVPSISSGEAELTALEDAPADDVRAQALATALGVRAALDGEFRACLDEWWGQVQTAQGCTVHNSVSGDVKDSTVVQGRDFSHLTFTMNRSAAAPGQER